MFRFTKEQRIHDIAGVKVGGQPGEYPTVMIGSIFYHKDVIVKDDKKGQFNREKAEELLKIEEEMSSKTGNPRIVDVCASYPRSFEKFIAFVADAVDGPFAIDGTTAEVRIAGVKYAEEVGLSNRIVYNSITPETKEVEIQAIREANVKSAVLLSLNSTNPTITGRLQVIDELIQKAEDACIENVLIDTTVMDLPDPGPAAKTIYLIKEKYGLPAGCGSHNAIAMWHKRKQLDYKTYLAGSVVADTLPISMGADFLVYGPIKNAPIIYTSIAVADAYVSYSVMQEYGIKPSTEDHPIFQVFRT